MRHSFLFPLPLLGTIALLSATGCAAPPEAAPLSDTPLPAAPLAQIATAPQSLAGDEKPTVDLSGDMPVDLINDPKTFARRVMEAMKRKRAADENAKQSELIAKGVLPPPTSSMERRIQLLKTERALEEEGDYPKMIEVARQHQTLDAADVNGLYYQGYGLHYQGDYAGAIAAWEKALKLDNSQRGKIAPLLTKARAIQTRWGAQPALEFADDASGIASRAQESQARAMLAVKDYAGIEARVAALTQSQQKTALGNWHLSSFFRGLTIPAPDAVDDKPWDDLLLQTQKWHAARPDSWLARLSLARVWMHLASRARGSAWAADVTPAQFQLMEERMAKMGEVLDEGGDLKKQMELSPLFADVVSSWALYSGLDSSTYDALTGVTKRKFPDYWNVDADTAYRLLPRWHGEPGQWELYAMDAADARAKTQGQQQGDALYARILAHMVSTLRDDNIWETTGADWPRTKRGLDALIAAEPDPLGLQTLKFEMAIQAADWPSARQALQKIGGKVERGYYKGNRRQFAVHREQALFN